MTPLDDELRAALHGRADVLTPSPDPLAGIESRARGLRRRRVAASVAGAALAVSAIAVVVPTLRTTGSGSTPEQLASPNQSLSTSQAYLDPQRPWAFRGKLSDGSRAAFEREWRLRHADATVSFLFGQTYEPSGQEEALFVSTGPDGDSWGFAHGTESGPEFVTEGVLDAQTAELHVALSGDEGVRRLLLVTAPDSTATATGATLTSLFPGVYVAPVEKRVTFTVRDAKGDQVGGGTVEPLSYDKEPTNVLDWPARGAQESDLLAPARAALAPSLPGDGEVLLRVLFTGDTDSGIEYVVGQVWRRGDTLARSFSYAEGYPQGPATFLGPETDADAKVLAFVFGQLPGTVEDLLVVVPNPLTGQVLYDDDATGSFRPITGQDQLDGVVLIDRDPMSSNDRLQLLDGNGGAPTFEGFVGSLLCGSKECG